MCMKIINVFVTQTIPSLTETLKLFQLEISQEQLGFTEIWLVCNFYLKTRNIYNDQNLGQKLKPNISMSGNHSVVKLLCLHLQTDKLMTCLWEPRFPNPQSELFPNNFCRRAIGSASRAPATVVGIDWENSTSISCRIRYPTVKFYNSHIGSKQLWGGRENVTFEQFRRPPK